MPADREPTGRHAIEGAAFSQKHVDYMSIEKFYVCTARMSRRAMVHATWPTRHAVGRVYETVVTNADAKETNTLLILPSILL
jgi:hypothetical protein